MIGALMVIAGHHGSHPGRPAILQSPARTSNKTGNSEDGKTRKPGKLTMGKHGDSARMAV